MRGLNDQVGRTVKVIWKDSRTQEIHAAQAVVRYPPTRSYVWSCVWFFQELLIFAVGARVFWKRPDDDSARLFFALCIVTVGAYMGGYHWTEIVVRPGLDLSVRVLRSLRAGGQPALLPGLPPAEPRVPASSPRWS